MARRVADPMGERAERVRVRVVGGEEEMANELAGPRVVDEPREELAAEREIAEVGDVRGAVRERARPLEVRRRDSVA